MKFAHCVKHFLGKKSMTSRSLLATSLIVALTLASVPSNRMAFASDAVASPEEVGFDRDRLQRMTKVSRAMWIAASCPARSS